MIGVDWGRQELEPVMKQLGETVRSLAAARAAIEDFRANRIKSKE